MAKQETNDLFKFIQGLKHENQLGFKRALQSSSSNSNKDILLDLFNALEKGSSFDQVTFVSKHDITENRFSSLKFQLLEELVNYLKLNYTKYSDISLHNKVLEYNILIDKGLHTKAIRKYKQIIEIAEDKNDFITCVSVQSKAIEHKLYAHPTSSDKNLQEAASRLNEYQNLTTNLNAYKILLNELLEAHYRFIDQRADASDEFLNYLDHDLLQDISNAKSVLAVFYFYRIIATVHYGHLDYEKSKEYSLKAYNHLKNNTSNFRNDSLRILVCLNNYIDASFYLNETEPYNMMYPLIKDVANQAYKTADNYSKSLIFQILTTLRLNYLVISKDTTSFLKEVKTINESYTKYESLLRPNFRLEIIINMCRLYFIAGDLATANEYCKKIDIEKSNPTSSFVSCLILLRIMINFDLKNYDFIQHLVTTSTYYLKTRDRLFEIERIFLHSIGKIGVTYSNRKQFIFNDLYSELKNISETSKNNIILHKTGLLQWVETNSSFSTSSMN